MHGWDHRPGGYDPIPGLGFAGLPYCIATISGVSLTSGTSAYMPFNSLVDSGSGLFATATGSGGQAAVEITAEGIYLAFCRLDVHTSSAPAAGASAQGEFQGGYYPLAGGNGTLFNQGAISGVYGCSAEHIVLWNLVPSYGNIPTVLNFIAAQTAGFTLTSANLDGQLFVVQLNPIGNSNF